jgi:ethanolamine utilization protein EutM
MTKALGLMETIGVGVSFEIADVMSKAANIQIINQETKDAALVTVSIEGELSAVYTAIEVGKERAEKMGKLVAFKVIPLPDPELITMLKKKVQDTFQTIF